MEKKIKDAFQAEEENNYKKVESLCLQILAENNDRLEIQILLGRSYFFQGKLDSARQLFFQLVQQYPQEELPHLFLGAVYNKMGQHEEAIREFKLIHPLQLYHPLYFTTYADSLQQTENKKESRDIYYEEIAAYESTGFISSEEILNKAYQNILFLDITLGNGQYYTDLNSYYSFLDSVEMTEQMQEYLANTIVYLCNLMENEWYRPLFLEFITYLKEKKYLTNNKCIDILQSAFSSWESYQYHEDQHISLFLETCLSTIHDKKYTDKTLVSPSEWEHIMILSLTYEWYLCLYYPTHTDEFEYIQKLYPYTYDNCRIYLEKIQKNSEKVLKDILDQLYHYTKDIGKAEFERSMYYAYEKESGEQTNPTYFYYGVDTYKRIHPKIGRNDPCPCGSGKKYKKCCGH